MADRKVCTFCGREGHRAGQCRLRRSAVFRADAARLVARVIVMPSAAVRWLHQHPDALTTGAALVALAAGVYIITGA